MDMMKRDLSGMKIRLSKFHIENSIPGCSSECAIAVALRSVFTTDKYTVEVVNDEAIITTTNNEVETTLNIYIEETVQHWISQYDNGEHVWAFTMIVNPHDEYDYALQIAELTTREQELQGRIGRLTELSNMMHLVNCGYMERTEIFDTIMNEYQGLYAETIYEFGKGEV